jgi:release factor glutamine methyltransferase
VRIRQEVQALPRDPLLTDRFAFGPATTRGEARAVLARAFRDQGVDAPEREASLVLAAAAALRSADLIGSPEVALGSAARSVAAFAARRAAGEPLSRIAGRREFWSLNFSISPDVLDPRADTETLVEAAAWAARARRSERLRILDLGTGSGALLAALLGEFPSSTGVAVDISESATAIARANFESLGLTARATVRVGDWGDGLNGGFDLIVSNPPYIPTGDIAGLDREVREHDPRIALDGGDDGLAAYRALAPEIARLLAPEGWFFLEFGQGQAEDVRAILERDSLGTLRVVDIVRDLAGVERVAIGRGIATREPVDENAPSPTARRKCT